MCGDKGIIKILISPISVIVNVASLLSVQRLLMVSVISVERYAGARSLLSALSWSVVFGIQIKETQLHTRSRTFLNSPWVSC